MLFTKTAVSSAVLALVNASAVSQRSSSGTGTFYGGNVAGGNCMFTTYTIPSSLFGTALSGADWSSGANCGACVKVTGPSGNSITAMIVDKCPECASGSLDLFTTAFSTLANPTLGKIPLTWDFVDCGITTPISVVSKSGDSANGFSMQVVNSNTRVTSLEVSTDGGSTWQATTRSDFNFFESPSGFGTTTVTVKITSITGDSIIINDVNVRSGVTATASSNFGSGSSSVATPAVEVVIPSSSAAAAVQVVPTPSSKAPVEAISTTTTEDPEAALSTAGAVFAETSSSTENIPTSSGVKSTVYRTTSILRTTTASATTTLTSTLSSSKTSSSKTSSSSSSSLASNTTVTVKDTEYVEAALPTDTNTYSIRVITISTCISTVIYSVVTVTPIATSASATPSVGITISYSSNATLPVASSTPKTLIFTGSAASLQGPIALAVFAGLVALLFA